MTVYLLYHKRQIDIDAYNVKIIGIYSSLDNVKDTVKRYLHIPGFEDYPYDFCIEAFDVPTHRKYSHARKKDVFLLQYEHPDTDDSDEKVDIIGIYPTRSSAVSAAKGERRGESRDKTASLPRGFYIDMYQVDEDNWTEGFVIMPSP